VGRIAAKAPDTLRTGHHVEIIEIAAVRRADRVIAARRLDDTDPRDKSRKAHPCLALVNFNGLGAFFGPDFVSARRRGGQAAK
jgi:hypothetical protein